MLNWLLCSSLCAFLIQAMDRHELITDFESYEKHVMNQSPSEFSDPYSTARAVILSPSSSVQKVRKGLQSLKVLADQNNFSPAQLMLGKLLYAIHRQKDAWNYLCKAVESGNVEAQLRIDLWFMKAHAYRPLESQESSLFFQHSHTLACLDALEKEYSNVEEFDPGVVSKVYSAFENLVSKSVQKYVKNKKLSANNAVFVPQKQSEILIEKNKNSCGTLENFLSVNPFMTPLSGNKKVRVSSDGTMALYNEKELYVGRAHEPFISVANAGWKLINEIVWSSNKSFALIADSNLVYIFTSDGSIITSYKESSGYIRGVDWSPDGRELSILGAKNEVIMLPIYQPHRVLPTDLCYIHQIKRLFDGGFVFVGPQNAIRVLKSCGSYIQVDTGHLGNVDKIDGSPQGHLAIAHERGVRIVQQAGSLIIDVNTSDLGFIHIIKWSPCDQLAICCEKGIRRACFDGLTVSFDMVPLCGIHKIEWSSVGELAILHDHKKITIWPPESSPLEVDVKELEYIELITWNSEGYLAFCGRNGVGIWKSGNPTIILNTDNLGNIYNLSWSSDGILIICGDKNIGTWHTPRS